MGRRALRKLPPEIDLSRHLLVLDQLPAPLPAATYFASPAGSIATVPAGRPLEIEVGSGKGLFLTKAASIYPDRDFLGIEIARKYAEHIASRLVRHQVPNARVIHGDAEKLFREHLAAHQAAAVHIYFPDPWWKKRHHKRRIMNEDFLLQVTRVLRPGGRLHFWTDVEEYFQLSMELIAKRIPLEGPLPVVESPALHDLDYRTHFERRKRMEGLPIFRAEFVKP